MCYPLQRNTYRHKAKTHNVPTSEALHSAHITGYQAATSFPRTAEPLEPEMFLQLTSMKQAWTLSCNKWFLFPMPEEEETDSTYLKYLRRPAADRAMSFLQWLRHYNENPAQTKRYKGAPLWQRLRPCQCSTQSSSISISSCTSRTLTAAPYIIHGKLLFHVQYHTSCRPNRCGGQTTA